jgi:hypothetical protein
VAQPLIRIENRKRSTWVFESWKPAAMEGGPPVHDHENDIVIGDMANTAEVMKSHGVAYSRRCPPPVVTVPKARFDALKPADRKVIESLVARGDFVMGPVAA